MNKEERKIREQLRRRSGLPSGQLRMLDSLPPAVWHRLPLGRRVDKILEWLAQYKSKTSSDMLYFVMYDIEDDKIRNHVAKYLIKKGCMRVQKSIYLAKSSSAIYQKIADTLLEINSMYKNNDSIFLLPVPEDKLRHMRIIGKNVDVEFVTDPPNVFFI